MPNITLPATLAAKMVSKKIGTSWPAQENVSEWTGKSYIVLLAGVERSAFQLTVRPLTTETEVREARAFFWALEGIANTFDFPVLPSPQGGNDTLLSGAASAGNKSVTVDNAVGLFPGMPITIVQPSGHRRFVVLTNVAGNTLTFTPALTEDCAIGANVLVTNPVSRVRMADPDFSYDDAMGIAGFTAAIREAL